MAEKTTALVVVLIEQLVSSRSRPIAMGGVERCNAGSEVSALFEELRGPLIRYMSCLGLSADDARDIAQEAFLRLCREFHAIGGAEHARAWLFRVAHNEACN